MTTDPFGPLYGVDHAPVGEEDLLFYWSTPGARDIANFIWDTDVPAVTDPWPQLEPASIRDALVMVLGGEDVTGRLYTLADLAKYETERGITLIPQDPCDHCGLWCGDKWCGLRNDEPTTVLEAVEWSDHGTVRAE